MQKSTPLDHLRREDEPQEGGAAQQMIDNVVHDLEEGGQPMPGYSQQEPPRMEDPRMQAPPQQMPPQQAPQQFEQFGGGFDPRDPQNPRVAHPGMMTGYRGGPPLENATFGQKLMNQAKEPLLVSILVVILSGTQVQQLIARFLPMANSNPFIGLLIRAVIAGLAFYLLRRFIPN